MSSKTDETQVLFDPIFLEHETGAHPECAARLTQIRRALEARSLWPETPPEIRPAQIDEIVRVHDRGYVRALERFAASGGGSLDADTVVSPKSPLAAATAAGAVRSAADAVLDGVASNALCLVRPPGHHARPTGGMGFCLYNSIAVAARHLVDERQLARVAIVDWDVHHGNGTQDAFFEDGRVLFVSLHRWPFYPGTGHREETGSGAGAGTTCNFPLPASTSREAYLDTFRMALEDEVAPFRPELVLVSAGFDAFRGDPIGGLGLEPEDFRALTDELAAVAASTAAGRIVSVLEGGYDLDHLGDCVVAHLEGLRAAAG